MLVQLHAQPRTTLGSATLPSYLMDFTVLNPANAPGLGDKTEWLCTTVVHGVADRSVATLSVSRRAASAET